MQKFNFKPAPRPQDVDEKTLKPEPGEIVSKNDYELNQAVVVPEDARDDGDRSGEVSRRAASRKTPGQTGRFAL